MTAAQLAAQAAVRIQRRIYLCILLVSLAIGVLLLRLFHLQVLDHESYTTLSEENRLRVVPAAAPRGRIFSRDGVLLAGHRLGYDLQVVAFEAGPPEDWLPELADLIELDETQLERYRKLREQRASFKALTLKADIQEAEVYRFAVNRHFFPGISVVGRAQRYYPRGAATAHLVGYVSRISAVDLERIDEQCANYTATAVDLERMDEQCANYAATDVIGKRGVERAYEALLHGREGYREEEINADGRPMRVVRETPARPGRDLHLSLDLALQLEAQALLDGMRGAVVAIEPATGRILALVSEPAFDPNLFTAGIPAPIYQALITSPDRPLYNRALQGQYPPGSVIKPFYALAALRYGLSDPQNEKRCSGYYRIAGRGRIFHDWKRGGHGNVNLVQAIAQSCDVFFYDLSLALGIRRLGQGLSDFGFGDRTGLKGGVEQPGLVPTPEWKLRARHEPWQKGETLSVGIGQGALLVTPLQLAVATAALANGETRLRPRLLLSEERPLPGDSEFPMEYDFSHLQLVREGMRQVVHGARGTARAVGRGLSYQAAGKTGTAQVVGLGKSRQLLEGNQGEMPREFEDHAWFIAYAPFENPRIALVVLVENGGSGSKGAAPLARRLLDQYLVAH